MASFALAIIPGWACPLLSPARGGRTLSRASFRLASLLLTLRDECLGHLYLLTPGLHGIQSRPGLAMTSSLAHLGLLSSGCGDGLFIVIVRASCPVTIPLVPLSEADAIGIGWPGQGSRHQRPIPLPAITPLAVGALSTATNCLTRRFDRRVERPGPFLEGFQFYQNSMRLRPSVHAPRSAIRVPGPLVLQNISSVTNANFVQLRQEQLSVTVGQLDSFQLVNR